jgi:hypothetical protein
LWPQQRPHQGRALQRATQWSLSGKARNDPLQHRCSTPLVVSSTPSDRKNRPFALQKCALQRQVRFINLTEPPRLFDMRNLFLCKKTIDTSEGPLAIRTDSTLSAYHRQTQIGSGREDPVLKLKGGSPLIALPTRREASGFE